MQIALFQVDAFTEQLFAGTPAAVCPLQTWLPEDLLLSIAAENNLSETAFFVSEGDPYLLRWFSPVSEVQLCGHATLAAAFVIFRFLRPEASSISFRTCSGPLRVEREPQGLILDFPAIPYRLCHAPPEALLAGLEAAPQAALDTGASAAERNYMVLAAAPGLGAARGHLFVSRFRAVR